MLSGTTSYGRTSVLNVRRLFAAVLSSGCGPSRLSSAPGCCSWGCGSASVAGNGVPGPKFPIRMDDWHLLVTEHGAHVWKRGAGAPLEMIPWIPVDGSISPGAVISCLRDDISRGTALVLMPKFAFVLRFLEQTVCAGIAQAQ